jgi:heme-degrading monooxygenase HmoA
MSVAPQAVALAPDAHRIQEPSIVRVWHGRTRFDRADAYAAFLVARALPDYRAVPGNLGAQVLRRDAPDAAHFLTVSYWESEAAIRAFAGEDLLKAKYYAEDADFLLEFEPEVVHYRLLTRD